MTASMVDSGFECFFFTFPFCAWLSTESQWFNQQQAQLASVGKTWFDAGSAVWLRIVRPLESKKKPFILMCILFSCVRQAYTIWIFEGMLSQCLWDFLLLRWRQYWYFSITRLIWLHFFNHFISWACCFYWCLSSIITHQSCCAWCLWVRSLIIVTQLLLNNLTGLSKQDER